MLRIGLLLIWLLHFLPLPLLARVGELFGMLLYLLGRERRNVARINLKLCFPQMGEAERATLLRRHFRAVGRSIVERGLAWWAPQQRIERLVQFEGEEYMRAVAGKPVIWLAPHFVGLDMGGVRLAISYDAASMYSHQKNPAFDAVLLKGRTRFGKQTLVSRQDGLRPAIRLIRQGTPFYYLPDMDFGTRDSLFVPFFGVRAATIAGVPRLARITGAVVLPCVTRMLPGGAGYVLKFYPAWEAYPTDDEAADVRRMNEFIEQRVLEMPEQYYWLHKRFKNRPPGEARFYD
ncbi:MAG: lipid A biosynthesis acyltransferase [Pseudomonadota bacterium]